MKEKKPIQTSNAPAAIGPYSQAIKSGSLVFISGQIPLDPSSMELVDSSISEQSEQVFKNLSAVAKAAGGSLNDIVKLTIFLTDLNEFGVVNEIMAAHFNKPYPARATIEVSALPKGAAIEVEAILST